MRMGSARRATAAISLSLTFALLLLAVLTALGAARPVAAQDPPVSPLQVVSWFSQPITSSGRAQIIVRGLVLNQAAHPVTWEGVRLELSDGSGTALAIGYGQTLLPVLASKEEGPFEVRATLPGAAPADLEVKLEARGGMQAPDRDRSLEAQRVITRTVGGELSLLGEVKNVGQRYLLAADTRIHIAFFAGRQVVALRAATLPVVHGAGLEGQGHGPEESYPWQVVLPDESWDTWRGWIVSTPYPEGRFPVPLGLLETKFEEGPTSGSGVRANALLVHCGFRSVAAARVVVVEEEAQGGLARFGAGSFALPGPLGPGASLPVQIDLEGVALTDVGRLSLRAYALASQTVRPSAWPCDRRPSFSRLWLPALAPTDLVVDPPVAAP